jgi:hypothetical protein
MGQAYANSSMQRLRFFAYHDKAAKSESDRQNNKGPFDSNQKQERSGNSSHAKASLQASPKFATRSMGKRRGCNSVTGNSLPNPYRTMAGILRAEHNKGWHAKRPKTRCPICQVTQKGEQK